MSKLNEFIVSLVTTLVFGLIAILTMNGDLKMKLIICLIGLWLTALFSAIWYGFDLFRTDNKLKDRTDELEDLKINHNILQVEHHQLKNLYLQLQQEANNVIASLNNDVIISEQEKGILLGRLQQANQVIGSIAGVTQ